VGGATAAVNASMATAQVSARVDLRMALAAIAFPHVVVDLRHARLPQECGSEP
jgi:hypothetical protein